MKAERPRPAEPPVQGKTSECYGPEYIADLVRSKERSHRGLGHLRIAKDVDSVIHREFASQRVAVRQRHDCEQQSDTQRVLHAMFARRICHPRMFAPATHNTAKTQLERSRDSSVFLTR